MKKVMMCLVIVMLMILGIKISNTYVREARVEKVENNVVTFVDTTDNEWEWEMKDGENYDEDQEVRLVMSNMDTTDITDDIIIKIK